MDHAPDVRKSHEPYQPSDDQDYNDDPYNVLHNIKSFRLLRQDRKIIRNSVYKFFLVLVGLYGYDTLKVGGRTILEHGHLVKYDLRGVYESLEAHSPGATLIDQGHTEIFRGIPFFRDRRLNFHAYLVRRCARGPMPLACSSWTFGISTKGRATVEPTSPQRIEGRIARNVGTKGYR